MQTGNNVRRIAESSESWGQRGEVVEIGEGRNSGRVRVFWTHYADGRKIDKPRRTWMKKEALIVTSTKINQLNDLHGPAMFIPEIVD